MMNFRKIAAASKGRLLLRYFTEDRPEPIHPPALDEAGRQLEEGGRLTAYYTGRDSRATWRPDMPALLAEAIGIDPRYMPRDAEMSRLFEGRRADDGEAWSRHKRKLSGFDLVFSPHKSVSLACEFAATPAESAAYWNAVDRAADRAMRYVAQELGWARKGAGGKDGADPGAVGWISFRHSTARPTVLLQDGKRGQTYLFDAPVAGDPHMHVHNFLMNLVVTAEGRVGSLDTKALTEVRVKEFGAYFQAVLADELRRLGVRIGYDADEQAVVIEAIPAHISKAFSKGRAEVEKKARSFARSQGLEWEGLKADEKMNLLRDAGAEGRLGKMKTDERNLWREQAKALGWAHATAMEGAACEVLSDAQRFDRAYAFATRHLAEEFKTAATITHEKLGLYAARGLIGTGIAGGPDDIRRVVALIEERGIRLRGEHVVLVTGRLDDMVRVTNTAQIRIEQRVMNLARAGARDCAGALSMTTLRDAIERTGVSFTAEQRAAVHALGEGGRLTLLTGVAGAGKTTLLQPLVEGWQNDRRFDERGRDVIGVAMAWRQADALKDAGIRETFALSSLLTMIEKNTFTATRNTVLVIDEVSQIGPRPMLRLLELQARTRMTIKMLGDREQAQAIEAGDSIELLKRALPPEALPELLTTLRQDTRRARAIAGLFREGNAADALTMKRADGHAMLAGGDREQVVARIADLYIARRDILMGSGSARGITVSAPTNDDAAEISQAIRARLKARGEISGEERIHRAIDQRGQSYDLALAHGDRVRLFRRTWGTIDGREQQVGNNGDVVTVLAQSDAGIRIRTRDGRVADVAWRRFADAETGRLLLGLGHALTIDAAQGITSDEHINALPRGTAGVTGFTSYVAESRARGITWTVISEGALYEAERHRQALGDITPVTITDLWARAAEDMSRKPYKSLGIDLLAASQRDREQATDTFIAASHHMESAQLADSQAGPRAFQRLRAAAVNETLLHLLPSLKHAIAENEVIVRDIDRQLEANQHLRALLAEDGATARRLDVAGANIPGGPSP
jgi:nucleoside-triphosphatase THEP1